jgi:hypothetical protein
MGRFTVILLSWSAVCFVSAASIFAGGVIDASPGRDLSSATGGITGPANRTWRTGAGRGHIYTRKGPFNPEFGRRPRPVGPLFPWGTIWYSQTNDSQSGGRDLPAAAKKQKKQQPIILNPDIFDPQPKDPKVIELSEGNYEKGFSAYKSGDYAGAVELLKTETRYSVVKATLGFMYFEGLGVTQDYSKAVDWFVAAAQQGNVVAQKNVGNIYAGGYGVPQDYSEAAKWYLMAAENNDATAQKRLADMYILGLGVPPDKREADKWYRRASENGNEAAGKYFHSFVDHDLDYCQTLLTQDLGLDYSDNLGVGDLETE